MSWRKYVPELIPYLVLTPEQLKSHVWEVKSSEHDSSQNWTRQFTALNRIKIHGTKTLNRKYTRSTERNKHCPHYRQNTECTTLNRLTAPINRTHTTWSRTQMFSTERKMDLQHLTEQGFTGTNRNVNEGWPGVRALEWVSWLFEAHSGLENFSPPSVSPTSCPPNRNEYEDLVSRWSWRLGSTLDTMNTFSYYPLDTMNTFIHNWFEIFFWM